MTALPTNISTGKVRGKFGSPILSAGDADGLPDFQALSGLEITFTPKPDVILDLGAAPDPVTFLTEKIVCTLDDNGYMIGPDGREGINLIATDDTDLAPTGWTYAVSFGGSQATYKRLAGFDISVPAGSTRWLTAIAPVPSASGSSTLSEIQAATIQMGVAVGQAQTAATAANASSAAAASSASAAATSASGAASAASAAVGAKADKTTLGYNPRDYGATGNGSTNDAPAFDSMIAAMNTAGHLTQNKPLTAIVPSGVYNVKAGGIRALVVSNVAITVSPDAIFLIQNGPVWTLGNSTTTIENFWVTGGQPRTTPTDTLAATCPWVYAVNAARVRIDNPKMLRCQIFKGVSNLVLTGITISNHSGSGPVDRHWVEIDTSAAPGAAAAGLYLINGGGYAYVPPTNPAISPRAITAATAANPVSVTSPTHGFTTGDRVRHGGVVGMTELNGVDATVTVVDANTYTLNGVDGTGFSAYTSGGWSAKLLWSWPYDSAVVGIKGHWDTVRIVGGLYQHWPWLWNIESMGTVSFVYDEEVVWDYGGKGRFNFALNGGSISNIRINGGWHFCLNEDWIKVTNPGAGFVTDVSIRGHVLGMTGGHFIYDSTNSILNLDVDGLRVMAMGRARIGPAYLIRAGSTGNNSANIRNVRSESASTYYSNGNTYLLPDTGIRLTANTRYRVEGCDIYALTTNYVLASDSFSGTRQRMIRNNKCYTGILPEYVTTAGVVPPASATNTTNHSGLTQQVFLRGGTMTAAAKNGVQVMSGAGPFSFEVTPGETWSVTYTAAPTLVVSYKD